MKLLIINGPNLNLLGEREKEIYGYTTYDELVNALIAYGNKKGVVVDVMQSNSEGNIIDMIQQSRFQYDGLIINAGAYTHYSYAIRDALAALTIPVVEVHISNIYKREPFRHQSVIAPVVCGQITGLGLYGYNAAIDYLLYQSTKKGEVDLG